MRKEEKPADRRCPHARSHLIHCAHSDDGSAPRSGVDTLYSVLVLTPSTTSMLHMLRSGPGTLSPAQSSRWQRQKAECKADGIGNAGEVARRIFTAICRAPHRIDQVHMHFDGFVIVLMAGIMVLGGGILIAMLALKVHGGT